MPELPIVPEFMIRAPRAPAASASAHAGAQAMKHAPRSPLVLESEGQLVGIVTDRDIEVRCLAQMAPCA